MIATEQDLMVWAFDPGELSLPERVFIPDFGCACSAIGRHDARDKRGIICRRLLCNGWQAGSLFYWSVIHRRDTISLPREMVLFVYLLVLCDCCGRFILKRCVFS